MMRYLILFIILINTSTKKLLAETVPLKIRKTSFIYCTHGIITKFNPQIKNTSSIIDLLALQIYDRLLEINSLTYKLNFSLITHWQSFDNGKTYRFYLKKNIQFQKTNWFTPTRKLNADDVVFSFLRIFDKKNPYHYVNNGKYPYFDSLQIKNNIFSIKKINSYIVEFKLYKPDASFIWHLSTYYAPILSEEYSKYLYKINHKELIDKQPVGTGPFMLDNYKNNQFIKLIRHDNYWKGKPLMKKIIIDLGSGATGRISKLLTGECDAFAYPPVSQLQLLKKNTCLRLSIIPNINIAYLIFNTKISPLNKLKIRKAISYAINKKKLIQSIYYNTAEIATSILPKASWAYNDQIKITEYDEKKAKKIFQESGLHDITLKFLVPVVAQSYNPSPLKTAELIQDDLKKIGIKTKIYLIDKNSLYKKNNYEYNMILDGLSLKNNDPDGFFRPLFSCEGINSYTNWSKWCNLHFNNIINKAIINQNIKFRINYYHQAQLLLKKELPILPLAYSLNLQAYRHNIKGLTTDPFGNPSFTNLYQDKSSNIFCN
ncbi:MAG: ABC transporter substrate-binding protein SapA [Arsenophonus sp.]|nr:MAG: ABC transporter substrate-binding protein SapA [Arsenophonus sp.]